MHNEQKKNTHRYRKSKRFVPIAWGLILLSSCANHAEQVTIEYLHDEGKGLLADDGYDYSIQFPEDWVFVSGQTLKDSGETEIENIAMINTLNPNEYVLIKYNSYRGDIFEHIRKNVNETKEMLQQSGGWNEEKSTVGEIEQTTINDYMIYRYKVHYVFEWDDSDQSTQWNYIIPLKDQTFALYTFVDVDEGSTNADLFLEAMNTLTKPGILSR